MSKIKLVLVTCLAVLVFGAVMSSVASAEWMVGGTNLTTNKALALATTVLEPFVLTVPATNITITCNALSVEKGQIRPGNTGFAESLNFSECEAAPPCTVSATINSVPVLVEATLDPANALATNLKFKPETKTTFATFTLGSSGGTCAATGTQGVTGTATVLAPEGFDERVSQKVVANTGANELKLGNSEAKLKGITDLKLESGETWSFL